MSKNHPFLLHGTTGRGDCKMGRHDVVCSSGGVLRRRSIVGADALRSLGF